MYFLATFLVAQFNYSYFGVSNGWYDDNWSSHESYDVIYGKPLSNPVKIDNYTYFRPFENCNVTVNTKSRTAQIKMLS